MGGALTILGDQINHSFKLQTSSKSNKLEQGRALKATLQSNKL